MVGHFETIGFDTRNEEDFEKLSIQAEKNGEILNIESAPSYYRCWKIGNHIELWVAIEKEYFQCFSPYYSTGRIIDMRLIYEVEDNNCEFERGYYAEVLDSETASDVPIIFDMPNSMITRKRTELNTVQKVELCGFAERIAYYASEDDFRKVKPRMSSTYYLPCGTFSPRVDDPDFKQSAHAFLAGIIKKVRKETNPITLKTFYHLTIENTLHEMDIVVSSEELSDKVETGAIVDGTFWFTGKIVE